jgi:hypothetical protein
MEILEDDRRGLFLSISSSKCVSNKTSKFTATNIGFRGKPSKQNVMLNKGVRLFSTPNKKGLNGLKSQVMPT